LAFNVRPLPMPAMPARPDDTPPSSSQWSGTARLTRRRHRSTPSVNVPSGTF
jgi:hypothetical protein